MYLVSVQFEPAGFIIFVEIENQSLLGRHSNHFKNIETNLKNGPLDKASMNNILHFASK